MKKVFMFLFLFLFVIVSPIFSQWQSTAINAIKFVGEELVNWAIGKGIDYSLNNLIHMIDDTHDNFYKLYQSNSVSSSEKLELRKLEDGFMYIKKEMLNNKNNIFYLKKRLDKSYQIIHILLID